MRIPKTLLAAAGLLALVAIPVLAATGLWSTLPLIGGAARCASSNFAGPGTITTTNCTTTVPAGPTSLTGAELVPADTQSTGGAATAYVAAPMLASGAYSYRSVITGQSIVIPNNVTNMVLVEAGTIATLTVAMPTTPYEGQVVNLTSDHTVSALTLNGSAGQTISNAPTALTISTTGAYGYSFVYRNTVWYRLR